MEPLRGSGLPVDEPTNAAELLGQPLSRILSLYTAFWSATSRSTLHHDTPLAAKGSSRASHPARPTAPPRLPRHRRPPAAARHHPNLRPSRAQRPSGRKGLGGLPARVHPGRDRVEELRVLALTGERDHVGAVPRRDAHRRAMTYPSVFVAGCVGASRDVTSQSRVEV